MKSIIATAVILAAFSAPAFAETTGTDALGLDHGSLRLSQQDPVTAGGPFAMAKEVKMTARSHGSHIRRSW